MAAAKRLDLHQEPRRRAHHRAPVRQVALERHQSRQPGEHAGLGAGPVQSTLIEREQCDLRALATNFHRACCAACAS